MCQSTVQAAANAPSPPLPAPTRRLLLRLPSAFPRLVSHPAAYFLLLVRFALASLMSSSVLAHSLAARAMSSA